MLHLLAALGHVRDYEPPDVIAELNDALPWTRRHTPEQRATEVAAFLLAAGGEG